MKLNKKLLTAIINNDRYRSLVLGCINEDTLMNYYSKTDEYIKEKAIYMKYDGLDFCFDSKFLDLKKKDFFHSDIVIKEFVRLIESRDHNTLYQLSSFILYSKGYEESRLFIKENYGINPASGGVCSNYIINNFKNAVVVLSNEDGYW